MLYAAPASLTLALLRPCGRPTVLAALALVVCLAVERWLVGTEFSWHNVGCYIVGVACILDVDVGLLWPCWGKGIQA